MPVDPTVLSTDDPGAASEALSNEVLKLKIDDLFQEVENLKRRVEGLENRSDLSGKRASSSAADQGRSSPGTSSSLDCR